MTVAVEGARFRTGWEPKMRTSTDLGNGVCEQYTAKETAHHNWRYGCKEVVGGHMEALLFT